VLGVLGFFLRHLILVSRFAHFHVHPCATCINSIWLNQAKAISQKMGRGPGTQAGENPALCILFFRLCSLLALSVTPVFVFDGESWPSIKHRKSVRSSTQHWMVTYLECMIDAFGFCHYIVSKITQCPASRCK